MMTTAEAAKRLRMMADNSLCISDEGALRAGAEALEGLQEANENLKGMKSDYLQYTLGYGNCLADIEKHIERLEEERKMLVSELIEELKKSPDDYVVYIQPSGEFNTPIEEVYENDNEEVIICVR